MVLPVFVTRYRWENLLHNQSTILLRNALRLSHDTAARLTAEVAALER